VSGKGVFKIGLSIKLFASLEATLDGRPLPGLHLREGERLLAYLVLQYGGKVSYRTLAQLFWPAEAELNIGFQGQFPNTRQAVRSLRQALGPEAVRLDSPAKGVVRFDLTGVDVDVIAFDQLVGAEDAVSWQEAFARYRGPLLEGWSEPWVVEARNRRKRSYERLLRRLTAHALAAAETAQAVAYQRAAVASAPEDEMLWRDLMQTLAQQGRYDQAEEEYDRLRERLKAQGKKPEEETEALLAKARRQARAAPILPAGTVTSSAAPDPAARSEATPQTGRTAVAVRPSGETEASAQTDPQPETAVVRERPQIALLYKRNAEPDESVLRLLEREMKAAGYRVFVDRHIAVGVKWVQEIERQLGLSEAVVPLLSPASIQSEMLEYEVEMADRMAQAQDGRPRLLPVRVGYEGPLPERSALATLLEPLQYTLWQSEEDNSRIVSELLFALQGPPLARAARIRLEPSGGAVPIDSPFYIERPADAAFKAAIARSDAIVLLKGSRQMGKTSLLARGLQAARAAGARVVLTDFQALNESQLASVDALLLALATAVAVQLDLDPPDPASWNPVFGSNMNMELFLRRKVFAGTAGPVVWGIDEVDRLFANPFAGEVFGLFRSWHNLRSLNPDGPWSWLTLAIAYATEAHLLITDPNQSPFNVGTRLTLEDFALDEVTELNLRYGRPLHSADEIERFYRLVNGQPYLTRRGLDEMTQHEWSFAEIESRADREDGPFGDHLRRLLASLVHSPEMAATVRNLLQGTPPERNHFYRLRSGGVLAGQAADEARLRCPLYAAYLKRHLL